MIKNFVVAFVIAAAAAVNAKKKAQLVKKQQQQIECLTPMLKLIYHHVGLEWTYNDNYLDTKRLVVSIDTDHDNIV